MRTPGRRLSTTAAVSATAAAALALAAGTAAAATAPGVTLAWRAVERDVVSAGEVVTPDRAPDGHFTLTLDARSTPLKVRQIEVRLTDRQGVADGSQIWDTVPRNGYWALGVVPTGGRVLNPAEKALAVTVRGKATFELYAANSGYFTAGQYFKVRVMLADGRALRAVARVR